MPKCQKCNYNFPPKELKDGLCRDCMNPEILEQEQRDEAKSREKHQIKLKELEVKEKAEKKEIRDKKNAIFITTETFIDIPIEKRVCVVSAQCVYGLNIFKDIFGFIRDIVGGRIDSIESGLDKANATVIKQLKEKAFLNGGDAIIAVKIEHTYNNANNGSILSVFATGTVVKLAS